jgi:hypothetical protein
MLNVVVTLVVRTELDVPRIAENDGAMVPFTTEPSPSPGSGPLLGSHGMGLAREVCGTAVTNASEHRRIPNSKKRRGTRILMPAPSVNGFRRSSRPTSNGSSLRGAELPEA